MGEQRWLVSTGQMGRHCRRLRRPAQGYPRDGESRVCDEEWGGLQTGPGVVKARIGISARTIRDRTGAGDCFEKTL